MVEALNEPVGADVTWGIPESYLPHRDSLPHGYTLGDCLNDVGSQRNISMSVLCLFHVCLMWHTINHSFRRWEGILKLDIKAHLNNHDYENWALAICLALYQMLDVHYHVHALLMKSELFSSYFRLVETEAERSTNLLKFTGLEISWAWFPKSGSVVLQLWPAQSAEYMKHSWSGQWSWCKEAAQVLAGQRGELFPVLEDRHWPFHPSVLRAHWLGQNCGLMLLPAQMHTVNTAREPGHGYSPTLLICQGPPSFVSGPQC